MNRTAPLSVITVLLFVFNRAMGTEVYFSPSPDCENRIVEAIENSKAEVTAAVYSINNQKITAALISANKRGVKVRVLTDRVQASQGSSKVLEMVDAGLDLRVHSKYKIEHNKFGVYDGKLVSTGSFNWTGPASRSNSENCIFLEAAPVVSKYSARFEELWVQNTAEGSKVRIAKIRNSKRAVSSQTN